jgi:hypothetical protein
MVDLGIGGKSIDDRGNSGNKKGSQEKKKVLSQDAKAVMVGSSEMYEFNS